VIYSYGITEQGTYHVKKNIPCQDYHHIVKCGDNTIVTSVADGLGSMKYSDIGSKLAATISANYCAEKIALLNNVNDVLGIIKVSFELAQSSIEKEAKNNGHSIDLYDTTLTLAVVHDNTLYYGHSGDSGIIALTVEGLYKQVTEQQRDEDDRVFSLFFKDRWVFQRFEQKVCSVLLATDGMLETFFPIYIKKELVNIHVTLAQFFMDNGALRIDELGEDAVKVRIGDFIRSIPDEQVNDDKTLVTLVNPSVKSKRQPDDYYKEPNWVELKKKYDEEKKRLLYPHLFKEQDAEKVAKSSAVSDNAVAGEKGSNESSPVKHRDSIIGRAIEVMTKKSIAILKSKG